MPTHRFETGQLLSTPGALEALGRCGEDPLSYLLRHKAGDWGDLDDEDKRANEHALVRGARILSAYVLSDGTRIWIITEGIDDAGHRAATTILLPAEY